MSHLVEGLVRSGQPHNLMSIPTLMSESTTTAESLLEVVQVQESGVTPPIQISDWSSALFRYVMQHTTVRKAFHWVPAIQERLMSRGVEELVRSGQPHNLIRIPTLMSESTIIAGIPITILGVSTVTPLTQKSAGSTALFQYV